MRKNTHIALLVTVLIFLSGYSFGNIVVLNGLTHENSALPGETYRAQIEIQNVSQYEKGVKIYQRDYWYHYNGETKHDAPGTLERSNATWVSYQPELLNLAPNEKAVINIEITIPNEAELNGSFWSVMMVEGIIPPDTVTQKGVSITTAIRYAVQLITNIGTTGKAELGFAGLELEKQEQNNFLNVFVENKGERLLKPELSLELFDEAGNSVGIVKAEKRKTLPGTSIRISLQLEGVKPGKYSGVIIADCGNEDLFGTNVSFEIS
jgi:hypothetical protein